MRRKAVRLTRSLVAAAQPGETDRFWWDAEVTGFGLKLTARGARSFVLQYRFANRTRRYTIGGLGRPWTLETARDRARLLLAEVVAGRDPQGAKQRSRRDMTVAELGRLYLAEGLAGRSAHSLANARRAFANHLIPRIGPRRVSQLTAADVDRLLAGIAAAAGRAAANQAVKALAAALGLAVRRGIAAQNPAAGVKLFRRRRAERFLDAGAYGRLGRALLAAEALGALNPHALAAIRLVALTGLRPGEALALTQDRVDLRRARLTLPCPWRGAKRITLGEPAVALLRARLDLACEDGVLFPGRERGRPLASLDYVWGRLRRAAELPGVRLLDLRYSFGATGAARESLLILGQVMGDRAPATRDRYQPFTGGDVRAAADRISGEVARQLGLTLETDQPPCGVAEAAQPFLAELSGRRFLRPVEAAALCGLTEGTLCNYRWQGVGPPFRKVGGRVAYPPDELETWAEARRRP